MAGTHASGFGRRGNHTKAEGAAVRTVTAGTHGTAGNDEGEGHQMSSLFQESNTTNGNYGTGLTGNGGTGLTGTHGTGLTGTYGTGMTGTHGNVGPQTTGQHTELPYPDHESQGAGRFETNPNSIVV